MSNRVCIRGCITSDDGSKTCGPRVCANISNPTAARGSNNGGGGNFTGTTTGKSVLPEGTREIENGVISHIVEGERVYAYTPEECSISCASNLRKRQRDCSTKNAFLDCDWLTCMHKSYDEFANCSGVCGRIRDNWTANQHLYPRGKLDHALLPSEDGQNSWTYCLRYKVGTGGPRFVLRGDGIDSMFINSINGIIIDKWALIKGSKGSALYPMRGN